MLELDLPDAPATTRLGAAVASALAGRAGAVLYLEGNLGAGKTTLARGLLRALGVTGPIRSPTYTLVEPYAGMSGPILHLDLYRLDDPREVHQLGLGDYPPESTLWVVEWPEKGAPLLPPADLAILLTTAHPGRRARLQWRGEEQPFLDRLRAAL